LGLWFGYGNVNGVDFSGVGAGTAMAMGRIRHRSVNAVANGTGKGTLDLTTEWVDANGKTVLRENAPEHDLPPSAPRHDRRAGHPEPRAVLRGLLALSDSALVAAG
jgi:hypothetical protein